MNFTPSEMSIRTTLRSKYGQSCIDLQRKYERCTEETVRFRNHIAFNLRCKREGVIPKGLRMRAPINTEKGKRIADVASRQFLNERIRLSNCKLRRLEEERKWREIGLRRAISDTSDFENLEATIKRKNEFVFVETRERQQRKFEGL